MIPDNLYKERHFKKEEDVTFDFFIKEMSSFPYLYASCCSFGKKKSKFLFSVTGSRPYSCAFDFFLIKKCHHSYI